MIGDRSEFAKMMSEGGALKNVIDNFTFITLSAIIPEGMAYEIVPDEIWGRVRIVVEEVPVTVKVEGSVVEITVEGEWDASQLAEDIRSRVEAVSEERCIVERIA